MKQLLSYIRAVVSGHEPADVPDRELLDRFAKNHDEAAFTALVGRYGGSVWSVCRRLVDREHDAEDAFQATFLTLARKAGSIRGGDSLPAWLHGVARRIAANLRRDARRQAATEANAAKLPRCANADPTWREGLAVLDEELARLPERYRAVLLVCCLDGRSRDEAASRLGWSEGQVKGRLERAREMLRRRLVGRGFPPAALLLAAAVSRPAEAGAAGMASSFGPPALVSSAINTAMALVSGPGTKAGVVSPKVAALMEGVLKTMFLTKLKTAMAVLLVLGMIGFAGGLLTYHTSAAQQGPAEKSSAESQKGDADAPKKAAKAEGKSQDAEGDKEKLQGTWTLVETQKHGKKVAAKDIPIEPHTLTIAGDKVVLHHLNANVTGIFPDTKGTFELDLTRKPKEITITWLIQWRGIYKVESDTLTICFNPDNAIRPDEFRTTADSGRVLFMYQRRKPNPEKGRPDLSNAAFPVEAKEATADKEPAWGKPLNGLRLGLCRADAKGDGKVRLMAVLANVTNDDLIVNLGLMLGNGKKQLPTAVGLTFTNGDGKKRILQRKVGGIAGRVDPFGVPLAAGAHYGISCDLEQYYDENAVGVPLAPGRYRVTAEFVGEAPANTTGLALMTYWTGTIQSADVQVTVPAKLAK